ncbi:MAG: phage terminase large subunit [Clostridia bacterium]|nr:phage terminase large subunit [Clostridia bacterium]
MEPPNARQTQFFSAEARYIAYGGARGGGKSWAVRRKAALLALRYSGAKLLLVRRTLPELKENHVRPLMTELNGIAQYKESDHSFSFPNGSLIKLGFCAGESDVLQYQGQEYDFIFVDEATQLTEYQFMWIASCCRGVNGIPKRIYLTCNPGGVGHAWVKRLFIDRDYRDGEYPEDYAFIPAKAEDNTVLREKDPGYLAWLNSLPEGQREAWRDGNWDAFLGQYFAEFRRDRHVCAPFAIPNSWRRYVTMDYGLDMCAVLWIAAAPDGRYFVYKELHREDLTISDAVTEILRINDGEEIYEFLAPPDLWSRQRETGRTTAEIFSEAGLFLTKTSNNRAAGWLAVKEMLKLRMGAEGEEMPRLQIFSNCLNLIKNLPLLRHDERDPTDCATEPHEITHAPDALRGFCIYRTSAALTDAPRDFVFSPQRGAKQQRSGLGYGQRTTTI